MVKVLCGNFCISCQRPLTRRYVLFRKISKSRTISVLK
nr:hypothetical protein [Vibrio vulnificus]